MNILKLKKIFYFVILLGLINLNLLYASDWNVYEDSTYRVRIKYPDTWTKKEGNQENNIGYFDGPKEGDYQENVAVKVSDSPSQISDLSVLSQDVIKRLQSYDPTAVLINAGPTSISGFSAYKCEVEYTIHTVDAPQKDYRVRNLMIFFQNGSKFYSITYGGTPNVYEKYFDTAMGIINSLELF